MADGRGVLGDEGVGFHLGGSDKQYSTCGDATDAETTTSPARGEHNDIGRQGND